MSTVTLRENELQLNGKATTLLCASLFYFRIPRENWEERMDQLRNTISDNVAVAADNVTAAVSDVAEKVGAAVPQAPAAEAADVRVEDAAEDAEGTEE